MTEEERKEASRKESACILVFVVWACAVFTFYVLR